MISGAATAKLKTTEPMISALTVVLVFDFLNSYAPYILLRPSNTISSH